MLPRLFTPRASRVAGPIPGTSALGLLLPPLLLLSSGALPISIRNEADVAVENGRRHLEMAQRPDGFWTMDGRDTVLPAFAFLGISSREAPAPLSSAARAALSRLAAAQPRKGAAAQVGSSAEGASPYMPPSLRGDAPEGQGGVSLAEDALIVAATLSLYGPDSLAPPSCAAGSVSGASAQGLLSAARIRLLRLDSGTTAPATAWLAHCALDLIPGRPEQPADWAPLFSRRLAAPSALLPSCTEAPSRNCAAKSCAIAGYARIRHGVGADTPAALLAHLRWLRAHTGDLLGEATPPGASRHPPQRGGLEKEGAPPSLRGDAPHTSPSPPSLRGDAPHTSPSPRSLRGDAPHTSPSPPSLRGDAPEGQGGVSPEDLYFIAVFLDATPPALVSAAGISAAWRSRIAQRLIATGRSDGQSGAVWGDPSGAQSLRQTLFAVATLAALGE